MTTLYVAGDSFASVSKTQAKGYSWSELLATSLDVDLVNIARPGASNLSIAIQIEWISQRISKDDYAVVMLTDHYRETLPSLTSLTNSNKNLLEKHSVHYTQVPYDGIEYSEPAELVSSIFTDDPAHKDYQAFFKDWFHPELAYFRDRMVIAGSVGLLARSTSRYVVCAGGFANGRENQTTTLTNLDLNIPSENFCEITSAWMTMTSANTDHGNHMDDRTHFQIANLLYKKVEKTS